MTKLPRPSVLHFVLSMCLVACKSLQEEPSPLDAGGGAVVPIDATSLLLDAGPDVGPLRIVAWGDSLVVRTSSAIAAATGREVIDFGVGGQGTPQIAARLGARPAHLTLVDDRIPIVGSARVRDFDVLLFQSGQGPQTSAGELAGVAGVLARVPGADGGDDFLEFVPNVRLTSDVTVPSGTPFHPDTEAYRDDLTLFWMGRNNYPDTQVVTDDIRACTSYLTTEHFLVLSVLNGNYAGEQRGGTRYQAIETINLGLQAEFGDRYLDVRSLLVAAFDPTDAKDVADHEADRPPSSLRADNIHVNAAGAARVAAAVEERLIDLGW
jgi:hypothetical protein